MMFLQIFCRSPLAPALFQPQLRRIPPRVARTGARPFECGCVAAVVREFMVSDGPESQNFEASMVFDYGKKNVRPISRRRRELDGAPRRPTGGEAGTLRFRITPELI